MRKSLIYFCFLLVLISSCTKDKLTLNTQSFYYWKTVFSLSEKEQKVLDSKSNSKLYMRYFDLDVVKNEVEPVGKIVFNSKPKIQVVPVLFITNAVFKKEDLKLNDLVEKTVLLINKISDYQDISYNEIQIDCDWSELTREKYFEFLKLIKEKSNKTLSATIRLHQVKYPEKTGTPPVDYGVLMYYNMGKIGADDVNSIYDRKTALKYTPSLKNYTLPLKTALPIFRWGVQLRNGQVLGLIPKINLEEVKYLKEISDNKFEVLKDTHYKNYYFKKKDIIKFEHVSYPDLKLLIKDINTYNHQATQEVIWYDLDEENFTTYENESLF